MLQHPDYRHTYDVVVTVAARGVAGQGSGGVCATLCDVKTNVTKRIVGGLNTTSVQFMDILALIAALQYHHDKMGGKDNMKTRVLVITENPELIELVSDENIDSMELTLLRWFYRHGYEIKWCWESASSDMHAAPHRLAHEARSAMRELACDQV